MKVLMIIESLHTGGKERQVVELLKALPLDDNVEVQLVVMAEEMHFSSVFDLDIKIHTVKRKGSGGLNVIAAVYRICKRFKPDILHTWGILAALYSLPAAKLLRLKILNGSVRFAVPFKTLSRKWIFSRVTYFFSDIVVANSFAGLKAQGLKNPQKFYVIYNGFDSLRLRSLAPRKEIKKKFSIKTKFVVGMVGSFSDAKDYQTFLSAAQNLLEKRNDVTFLCVGDGPGLEKTKNSLSHGYKDLIKFPGRQEKVEPIINIFDIGVLTCNTIGHAEGMSNSIMEYMALGKPVIATDSGGNKEIVDDRKTGYIINPFAVDELTDKINLLLNDTNKRREMGEAGRERIINEFDSQKMACRYLDLYKEILK